MPPQSDDPAQPDKPDFPVAPQATSLLRRLAPRAPERRPPKPDPQPPPAELEETPTDLPVLDLSAAAPLHPDRPTQHLRRSVVAGLLGMAILDNWSGDVLRLMGQFDVPRATITPLLETRRVIDDTTVRERPTPYRLEDGRWLCVVNGVFTVSVSLFSAEPSTVQLVQQGKLHRDFEKQNRRPLELGETDPALLTFPQDTLFEA